jgi:peptidoglycan-N-acetylglucosamine deacetylase
VPLTFTFDLEDDGRAVPRYEAATYRLLELLEREGVTATVFVVGALAERSPELVRAVAQAGHEIALHGYEHVALDTLGEDGFARDVRRGKAVLEGLVGQEVRGYRAPLFSLTARTPWAPELLSELGFAYSSSVLPAPNPIRGYPGAPREPFRWDGGLVELPCPVAGVGRLALPYLGGVYLRYLPRGLIRFLVGRTESGVRPWTYLHPYDLDAGAPFAVLPHASWLVSRILHHRRGQTLDRVSELLRRFGPGPTLGALTDELAESPLPRFA